MATVAGTKFATAQFTLSTSASLLSVQNDARTSIAIANMDASITIFVGNVGVTSSMGFPVKAGAAITIETTSAVYAVAASGTPTVAVITEQ